MDKRAAGVVTGAGEHRGSWVVTRGSWVAKGQVDTGAAGWSQFLGGKEARLVQSQGPSLRHLVPCRTLLLHASLGSRAPTSLLRPGALNPLLVDKSPEHFPTAWFSPPVSISSHPLECHPSVVSSPSVKGSSPGLPALPTSLPAATSIPGRPRPPESL